MSQPVDLRQDYAADVRRLAKRSRHTRQARHLLALAGVYDGVSRSRAAEIGGMDRQTLRDWVHRYNAEGPDGLRDRHRSGRDRRLNADRLRELAQIVEAGPRGGAGGVGSPIGAPRGVALGAQAGLALFVVFVFRDEALGRGKAIAPGVAVQRLQGRPGRAGRTDRTGLRPSKMPSLRSRWLVSSRPQVRRYVNFSAVDGRL